MSDAVATVVCNKTFSMTTFETAKHVLPLGVSAKFRTARGHDEEKKEEEVAPPRARTAENPEKILRVNSMYRTDLLRAWPRHHR